MLGTSSQAQLTPFDFQLNQLLYTTSDGKQVDLRAIFVELNIFEDIFQNCMSCKLIITDSTNIFGHVVLQGSEFLTVSWDKPSLNKPITKTFRIYGRSKIDPAKVSNQQVMISGVSQELMVSKATKVSKTYNNMLISDMAKDVGRNILKITTTNFPDTNIEPTKSVQNLTIPFYNPLQTLNWLASKATSTFVGGTYMFYENQKGYNFQSLQKLMSQQTPVATYNHNAIKNINDATPKTSDPNKDFFDVQRYQILDTPDPLSALMTGHHAAQLFTLDVLRQKFTVGNLNADDLFQDSVSLGAGKTYSTFSDRLKNTPATSYPAYRKYYPTNEGQNQAQYIQGKQQVNPTNVENWLVERNALLLQLMEIRVKAIVPGNNMLKCGDVIKFNMPSIEPQSGVQEGSIQRKLDPYMQGLYLITAIRHRITVRTYETVLELAKDSYDQAMPTSLQGNQTIQGYA